MDDDLRSAQEDKLSGDRRRWGSTERRCGVTAVLATLLGCASAGGAQSPAREADLVDLPEAPSAILRAQTDSSSTDSQTAATGQTPTENGEGSGAPPVAQRRNTLPLCPYGDYPRMGARGTTGTAKTTTSPAAEVAPPPVQSAPCRQENPIQPIVTSSTESLTSRQKGKLAFRNFTDPFNFLTIAAYSGISVAINAHTAYGPGFAGWGRYTGYALAEDGQGEFFQTYAIPSLVHQDPRYHRMPDAPVKRRIWHAISHTYVAQHDDGRPMPNYGTLLTYPISAALSNLYVPGIRTDVPSTAKRVAIGIASDPAGTLAAEFLPDLARHIHIHAVFVQEILDHVATNGVEGVPATTVQRDPNGGRAAQ
jgi:hypothetical protein